MLTFAILHHRMKITVVFCLKVKNEAEPDLCADRSPDRAGIPVRIHCRKSAPISKD